MKKKLLFVIPSLDAGGAEKSLVNLLNVIDQGKYAVDLFMFSHHGLFMDQVPDFVNQVPKNADLKIFQYSLFKSLLTFFLKGRYGLFRDRFMFYFINRTVANKGIAEQKSWKYLRNACAGLNGNYDAAIGFLEKSSAYFVVDKVSAETKIGFIHNDYNKLILNRELDAPYFKKLKYIATVSEECVSVLKKEFPSYQNKVKFFPNIVSETLVNKLAGMPSETLSAGAVVSIGRLHPQKGFDMAIKAAALLKAKDVHFHWYIIGEGTERKYLQMLIQKNVVSDVVTLLGLRGNPYSYIKKAAVFVQPSRYEGKSIAVDEAKILGKPIVLTNFTTAKDQIEDGVTGLIVEMTPEAVAHGIRRFLENSSFTENITSNLKSGNYGTEHEVQKFYALIHD